LLYTNWLCESINTSAFIGKDVTLEFYMSDCGLGGHFGYAYIDDICGSCPSPNFGDLYLNPININCPTFPYNVSGTLIPPQATTLTSLTLNVLNGSTIVGTVVVPLSSVNTAVSPYTFSYPINPSNFGSSISTSATYHVSAIAVFTNSVGFQQTLTNTEIGTGIKFLNCCYPTPSNNPSTNKSSKINTDNNIKKKIKKH